MKSLITGTALALALTLGGCGEGGGGKNGTAAAPKAGPAIPAPNGGDWTQTVAETPEGGYRMGNPDAPVKLVEYASISCSHCADFSVEAGETLRNEFVKSGRLSWEFRPYMLFPTDPGIFMLLRCRGAGPFFQLTDQLYADQKNWIGRLQTLPQAQLQQIQTMAPPQRIAALVQAGGMDQFFRQRGMTEASINSCLADQTGLQRLVNITDTGTNQYKVGGTPSFFINDEQVELAQTPSPWQQLQPKLRQAVGQ